MSATTMLARLAAGSAVATCAVLASLTIATPAQAEDVVDVRISSLSSSLTAGGRTDSFSVRLQNRDEDHEYVPVRRVFIIRLDGLSADGVRITGRFGGELPRESTGAGEVRVTDPLLVSLGRDGRARDRITGQYEIQFTSTAPNGPATVVAEAHLRDMVLGSDSDTVTVRGGSQAQPTPTTEAPPAESPLPVATAAAPSPLAAVDGDAVAGVSDGGGLPVIFYVLGGVLVAAGGVILWLLFRDSGPALADAGGGGAYEPVHPSHPMYPPQPLHPTAVIPVVREPYVAQHGGADPWAAQEQGRPDDATRDFGEPLNPRL